MMYFTKQFADRDTANAKTPDGKRFWLVKQQGPRLVLPYPGWNRDRKDMVQAETMEDVLTAFGLVAYTPPVVAVAPVRITQFQVMTRLDAIGKWGAFKALLELPGMEKAKDGFYLADYLEDTNPLFVEYAPQLKAMLELTDEQFHSIIAG